MDGLPQGCGFPIGNTLGTNLAPSHQYKINLFVHVQKIVKTK